MTCNEKRRYKRTKFTLGRSIKNTQNTKNFIPAGDVSLGNSRVQANGLSNSLSNRKHFFGSDKTKSVCCVTCVFSKKEVKKGEGAHLSSHFFFALLI